MEVRSGRRSHQECIALLRSKQSVAFDEALQHQQQAFFAHAARVHAQCPTGHPMAAKYSSGLPDFGSYG